MSHEGSDSIVVVSSVDQIQEQIDDLMVNIFQSVCNYNEFNAIAKNTNESSSGVNAEMEIARSKMDYVNDKSKIIVEKFKCLENSIDTLIGINHSVEVQEHLINQKSLEYLATKERIIGLEKELSDVASGIDDRIREVLSTKIK